MKDTATNRPAKPENQRTSTPADSSDGQANNSLPLPTGKVVDSPEDTLSKLKRKWGFRSPSELHQRCQELGGERYIIEGLIPARAQAIFVGDSGLGKSPLLYQASICVAAGVSFIGHPVEQGKVLYLDFENGIAQSDTLVERLTTYLEIDDRMKESVERNLFVWTYADAPPGAMGYSQMILEVRPDLVIIDPLSSYNSLAEEQNSTAADVCQHFRKLSREVGGSIIFVHHLKKPTNDPGGTGRLEGENLTRWFCQVRGASALVNNTDVRIGVDAPVLDHKVALVMRGFRRVHGEIPTIHLARDCDEDGEPRGYRRLGGIELLTNPYQKAAFARLPDSFTFKAAKQIYDRADQATKGFLEKCKGLGLLRRPARGMYEKLKGAE